MCIPPWMPPLLSCQHWLALSDRCIIVSNSYPNTLFYFNFGTLATDRIRVTIVIWQ